MDKPIDQPRPEADALDPAARTRAQLELIRRAFKDEVGIAGGDGDAENDVAFIYRREHILVRDEDIERVQAALGGADQAPIVDGLVHGVSRLGLPPGRDVPEVLDELDAAVGVGVATPDHLMWVVPGSLCPATEPEEPGTKAPHPPVTWASGNGQGVLVSVVDTGWHPPAATDPLSPWLAGVTGDVEVIDPANIHPYAGHGTFIAGVVRCEAPAAEVRVEGFFPVAGAAFESDMVVQLCQALELGPDLISLSAGTTTRANRPTLSLEVFHQNFLSKVKGTVLVAAAGNDATRAPFWPAAFPWAISVGAIDASGQRASFSNFGSWVDAYALGVDLVNAFPHGDFTCVEPPHVGESRHFEGLCRWSGTSFSTPVVAGRIAARMSQTGLSARRAADQLLAQARAGAVPGVGPCL
jgi:subtilisin family serine protease